MIRTIVILVLIAVAAPGHAADSSQGQSMLSYFQSRLPATIPPAPTDTMPIMQGNGAAMRMVNPADLTVGKVASTSDGTIVAMKQGPTEAPDANKFELRDAAGNLTMVITATGALRFFNVAP